MRYSVIIPVYNAEKTLNRCVNSLIDQDYSDAEIILVNDGSSDGSGDICEQYAREYPNIQYIHQENSGVSAARNAGLDAAEGDYVLFVDSDDYVISSFFSTINEMIDEDCPDLIQFSACIDDGKIKKDILREPLMDSSREELFPHIINAICTKTINAPHAKLYKREIIEKNSIRFPIGASVAEDRVFNIAYSFYIKSYRAVDTVAYVINTENENSLSRKRHKDLQEQFAVTRDYINDKLAFAPIPEKEKELYRRALNFGSCRSVYHDAKLMIQDKEKWLSRQKRLMQLCRSINRKHMKYPKTGYCRMITLPVRLYLTPVIDAAAWALIHR